MLGLQDVNQEASVWPTGTVLRLRLVVKEDVSILVLDNVAEVLFAM